MGGGGPFLAPEIDFGVAVLTEVAGHGVGLGFSWCGVISVVASGPRGLPGSSSGGVSPAFGWKLFIDAQAFSAPSTEK